MDFEIGRVIVLLFWAVILNGVYILRIFVYCRKRRNFPGFWFGGYMFDNKTSNSKKSLIATGYVISLLIIFILLEIIFGIRLA
jgi:hypothetical protein